MAEPWIIRLAEGNGFPLGRRGVEIRVANAATFLAHKVLAYRDRKDDQFKDVIYILDTLAIFSDALDQLRGVWGQVSSTLHPKTIERFETQRQQLFSAVTDPIRKAAIEIRKLGRMAQSPEDLARTCRFGLDSIFGKSRE